MESTRSVFWTDINLPLLLPKSAKFGFLNVAKNNKLFNQLYLIFKIHDYNYRDRGIFVLNILLNEIRNT